jgi:putative transposase
VASISIFFASENVIWERLPRGSLQPDGLTGFLPIRDCWLALASGTISGMPRDAIIERPSGVLVSHPGVPLSRPTTFRFTLDPAAPSTAGSSPRRSRPAGIQPPHRTGPWPTSQRAAERSYGVAEADLTPSLSFSKVSFINHMNAWKDGRAADTLVALDAGGKPGRGLAWRGEVSTDVFECASVDAAALTNWSKSRTGQRAGKAAGFPRFKSRHKTEPAFRLRSPATSTDVSCTRGRG